MPTAKQLAANRQNALRSTGPRTQAGKAASRYNALQHGILSRALIPSVLEPYESRAEFDALHAGLRRDLDPSSPLEDLLVERIAVCCWRQSRLLRAEAGAIARRQACPDEQSLPYDSLDRGLGVPGRDDLAPLPDLGDLAALLYAEPSPEDAPPDDDVLPNEPNFLPTASPVRQASRPVLPVDESLPNEPISPTEPLPPPYAKQEGLALPNAASPADDGVLPNEPNSPTAPPSPAFIVGEVSGMRAIDSGPRPVPHTTRNYQTNPFRPPRAPG